ncbi:hypothetical protein KY285_011646 [Solanum tuberosum]|nr:hypothetical protein KY285_011646 [Solanum tuberosum]
MEYDIHLLDQGNQQTSGRRTRTARMQTKKKKKKRWWRKKILMNANEDGDDDEEQEACAICLLEYKDEDNIGTLQCGHEFHAECINKWLQRKTSFIDA